MVITDLPACRKNSAVHATTSAAVFSPPTTSTSGIRYGGLNGWATTSRCGDRASTAISVIAEARGGRGDDDVLRGGRVDGGQQPALEVELLRGALLHDVGVGDGIGQSAATVRLSTLAPGARPSSVSAGQAASTSAAQPLLGVRRGVPGAHREPAGQEVGHPAAADDPGPDAGDGAHLVGGDASWARSCSRP